MRNMINYYFGFFFIVSPDFGFTMHSSLLIRPETLFEKL